MKLLSWINSRLKDLVNLFFWSFNKRSPVVEKEYDGYGDSIVEAGYHHHSYTLPELFDCELLAIARQVQDLLNNSRGIPSCKRYVLERAGIEDDMDTDHKLHDLYAFKVELMHQNELIISGDSMHLSSCTVGSPIFETIFFEQTEERKGSMTCLR